MTGSMDDKIFEPKENVLYQGLENLPAALWEDLAALEPSKVSRRAGVGYSPEEGYTVHFLGTDHKVQPAQRTITVPDGAKRPGFQAGLVLVSYLAKASEEILSGRMVTARELNGGDLFFQGVHALPKARILKKYARDGAGLVSRASLLGGTSMRAGDAAFRLLALPKALVAYTFYEEDEEFPARLTITFDASIESHLPLDVILALTNVISDRLVR